MPVPPASLSLSRPSFLIPFFALFSLLGLALIDELHPAQAGIETTYAFNRTYVDLNYGGNGRPGWVRSGDMDGDGDLDIVAGGGYALYIYENNGQGAGWSRYGNLDGDAAIGANGGVLLDIDNDQDLDIVSAHYQGDIGWWQNPGSALSHTAWSFHTLSQESRYMHDIILVDIDGDGIPRELIANLNQGYWNTHIQLKWYREGADPTQPWTGHTIEPGRSEGAAHGHAGLDLADADDDGDADLAFANGWYEAPDTPTGGWVWHEVTAIYGLSNSLWRHMNGDDRLDLVVSAGHHGTGVYWFEAPLDPSQGEWVQHDVDVTLHHPECLQVEDLDADGEDEIISCDLFFGEEPGEPGWNEEVHNIYVFDNAGPGSGWLRQNVAPNGFPSHLLQMVDINDDGRLDIISEATGTSVISYFENETGTAPPPPPGPLFDFDLEEVDSAYPGNGRPGWSASGDIDGDGLPDVVAGGGSALQWYRAPEWTRFPLEINSTAGGNGGLVYDVDGDDKLDVIAALYNGDLAWWHNPGGVQLTGTWNRYPIDSDISTYNHDLILADIDGDTEEEIVALYVGDNGVRWYDIPADPLHEPFPMSIIRPAISHPYVGLASGDLDGDDDVDVVAANSWYENPSWQEHSLFAEPVQNLYVVDVNGDDKMDVVAAEGFVNPNGRILWAQAPSSESVDWTVHLVAEGLDGPENLWAGDLDGDGLVDVVSAEMGTSDGYNDSDSNLIVFRGLDATGLAWQPHVVVSQVGVSARLNPVDIDGDSDIDFTADGNAEDHIYLWVNGTTPALNLPAASYLPLVTDP